MPDLRSACTLILFAGAAICVPPSAKSLREFGSWCVRPARLPFAWQGLIASTKDGDAREMFARGQQIMQLVPSWTDGHAAFVYRYVFASDDSQSPGLAAEAAERRLRAGLTVLEQARQHAGDREQELLQSAAFLPDLACRQFPGLAERLLPSGGAASIADAYLEEAERLFPSPARREQRLWHAPRLVGALLACNATKEALAVLDRAIEQAPEIRDRRVATEWRQRLIEVTAFLRGSHDTDLTAVLADPRFAPVQPYLR